VRLGSALTFVLAISPTHHAAAQAIDPRADAEVVARIHYDAGREHYVAEHYADALREFVEAYRLSNRAELLYNRARCFEELGFPDEAVGCYRGYLAGTFASNEKEVEARIVALSRRRRGAQVSGTCPTELPSPPPLRRTPLVRRWWFWTTLAVGTAVISGVVAGAVLGTRPPEAVPFPKVN